MMSGDMWRDQSRILTQTLGSGGEERVGERSEERGEERERGGAGRRLAGSRTVNHNWGPFTALMELITGNLGDNSNIDFVHHYFLDRRAHV